MSDRGRKNSSIERRAPDGLDDHNEIVETRAAEDKDDPMAADGHQKVPRSKKPLLRVSDAESDAWHGESIRTVTTDTTDSDQVEQMIHLVAVDIEGNDLIFQKALLDSGMLPSLVGTFVAKVSGWDPDSPNDEDMDVLTQVDGRELALLGRVELRLRTESGTEPMSIWSYVLDSDKPYGWDLIIGKKAIDAFNLEKYRNQSIMSRLQLDHRGK